MKLNGPIVTLFAGLALGVGLLAANVAVTSRDIEPAGNGVPSAGAASTAAASTSTASSSPTVAQSPAVVASPSGGGPPTSGVRTYAGKVTGGGPLAIVVKGSNAIAYLCDGTNEAWLWGSADADTVTLKNAKGGALSARWSAGGLTGDIAVRGRHWTFSLAQHAKPSGLYRSAARIRGATVVSGWIVLADGQQVGMSTGQEGNSERAQPLDARTGRASVRGVVVVATVPDPGETHV